MGFNTPPPLLTKLHLPLAGKPHCEVEIEGRCLLAAMGNVTYPPDARHAKSSGKVVLAASIDPDGSVRGIRISESMSNGLANAAIRDLRTWRFDAADRRDLFRVTYSYEIDESRLRGGAPSAEWTAPGEVRVRAH
jgi:TonB family protein